MEHKNTEGYLNILWEGLEVVLLVVSSLFTAQDSITKPHLTVMEPRKHTQADSEGTRNG